MDVRALIVVGSREQDSGEFAAGLPLALLDVLGRSVLGRIIVRLRKFGIEQVAVVSQYPELSHNSACTHWTSQGTQPWQTSERVFLEIAQGADVVLILRAGGYAELDYTDLLRFHRDQGNHVTAVAQPSGDFIGTFMVSASRQNDAFYLLRHHLNILRTPCSVYSFSGYFNLLDNATDLRTLAIDAFCGNVELQPEGTEMRPGVWVAPGAMIHKRARVLAPAYIGAHARVRAAVLITRCSVLEHHAHVDCGTVVDNATILPNTSIGAGLEVSHAVVGFRRYVHLGRNIDVEIADPKLIGTVSAAPVRLLKGIASLAAFLPAQMAKGIAGKAHSKAKPSTPDIVQAPSAVPESLTEQEFPANLVVARRYGNE
jgi:hypothetical protein